MGILKRLGLSCDPIESREDIDDGNQSHRFKQRGAFPTSSTQSLLCPAASSRTFIDESPLSGSQSSDNDHTCTSTTHVALSHDGDNDAIISVRVDSPVPEDGDRVLLFLDVRGGDKSRHKRQGLGEEKKERSQWRFFRRSLWKKLDDDAFSIHDDDDDEPDTTMTIPSASKNAAGYATLINDGKSIGSAAYVQDPNSDSFSLMVGTDTSAAPAPAPGENRPSDMLGTDREPDEDADDGAGAGSDDGSSDTDGSHSTVQLSNKSLSHSQASAQNGGHVSPEPQLHYENIGTPPPPIADILQPMSRSRSDGYASDVSSLSTVPFEAEDDEGSIDWDKNSLAFHLTTNKHVVSPRTKAIFSDQLQLQHTLSNHSIKVDKKDSKDHGETPLLSPSPSANDDNNHDTAPVPAVTSVTHVLVLLIEPRARLFELVQIPRQLTLQKFIAGISTEATDTRLARQSYVGVAVAGALVDDPNALLNVVMSQHDPSQPLLLVPQNCPIEQVTMIANRLLESPQVSQLLHAPGNAALLTRRKVAVAAAKAT